MKRRHLLITGSLIIGIMIVVLCSSNLITTDKDRFYVDEDNYLKMIDIEKTGPDIVVPEKVGDNVIRTIYLEGSYFSKIDSIDVSNVSELESFTLELWGAEVIQSSKELILVRIKGSKVYTSLKPKH